MKKTQREAGAIQSRGKQESEEAKRRSRWQDWRKEGKPGNSEEYKQEGHSTPRAVESRRVKRTTCSASDLMSIDQIIHVQVSFQDLRFDMPVAQRDDTVRGRVKSQNGGDGRAKPRDLRDEEWESGGAYKRQTHVL